MKNFPSTDTAVASCIGKSSLFDSRLPADHAVAKQLCAGCPVALACWDNLQAVKSSPKDRGGSPEGTWAGQLFGRQSEGAARRNKPEGVNAA